MKWHWKRVVGLIAPLCVLGMMAYVYFAFIVVVCHDFYTVGGLPALAFFLGLVFNVLFLGTIVSYILTVFTPAGTVPLSWTTAPPQVEGVPQPPFCDKCHMFKPERTHHCSSCEEYAISAVF